MSADLPLPDGRLVPNISFAGVPGGIPDVPVVVRMDAYGGAPGTDVSDALEAAAEAAAEKGGGAVLIGPGDFFLDRPVHISRSGVVLRGSGIDNTTLTFRWEPPKNSVVFVGTRDGETIPPLRTLVVAAWNDSRDNKMIRCIKRLSLEINGKVVAERKETESNEGPWFTLIPDNRETARSLKSGENTLRASVEYLDGRSAEQGIRVIVREGGGPEFTARDAAIHFSPATYAQEFFPLASTKVKRGQTRIDLLKADGLKPGDAVMLKSTGESWTAWPWHLIQAVEGNTVILQTPVRLDMSLDSFRRMPSIVGSGIEDLTLRQTSGHWTSLLAFESDVACFARRVRLSSAGRFPLTGGKKHFEMRDCDVDGSQFHSGIGGGTAYLGFSGSYDGLISGIRSKGLRHAPNIQGGSMGCVIRASTFEHSGAQFHSSPNWENLFENNTVNSVGGSFGSYGAGFYVCARPRSSFGGSGNMFYRNHVTFQNTPDPRWPAAAIQWEGGNGTDQWIAGNRFERVKGAGPLIAFSGFATQVDIDSNFFIDRTTGFPLVDGNASAASLRGNTFFVPPDSNPNAPEGARQWSQNRIVHEPAPLELPGTLPPSIFEHQSRQVSGEQP